MVIQDKLNYARILFGLIFNAIFYLGLILSFVKSIY
jgi:hypothetical protein